MRKHNAPLGKWGRALYRAGLKSHRLRRNGTAEELRRLHEACQNAESVPRLEEESRRLFCSVVRGTFFAEDWDVFVRVKKETYPFVRPAFDVRKDEAYQIMKNILKDELLK